MTTILDDVNFSRCSLADNVPGGSDDYGYGDGAPTPSAIEYGYGEAPPTPATTANLGYVSTHSRDDLGGNISTHSTASMYSYSTCDGDSAAATRHRRERPRRRGSVTKYSLDAQQKVAEEFQHEDHEATIATNKAPDTPSGRARKSRRKYSEDLGATSETADKYGYGDMASESNDDADKYGYGDTTTDADNKYGYGDCSGQAARSPNHRISSASRSSTHSFSSYSSCSYDSSCVDETEVAQRRRRERPRRRGSVTKYSLDAAVQVQQGEHVVIPPESNFVVEVHRNNSAVSVASDIEDSDIDDDSQDEEKMNKVQKEKTKPSRFGRFRIGRNKSSHI